MIFPYFAVLYIHAETVCIRVCCKDQVCIDFFAEGKSKFKCLCCFRVRVAYGREVSIRQLLLRNNVYIFKTKFF